MFIFFEWLIWKLKQIGRSMRSKHGHLNVSNKGEAEILIDFRPKEVEAYFIDNPCLPPSPGCAPLPDPDQVKIHIKETGRHQWAIFIEWNVSQPRVVEWKAFRHLF